MSRVVIVPPPRFITTAASFDELKAFSPILAGIGYDFTCHCRRSRRGLSWRCRLSGALRPSDESVPTNKFILKSDPTIFCSNFIEELRTFRRNTGGLAVRSTVRSNPAAEL